MDNNHIDANRRWLRLSEKEFEDILDLIIKTGIKDLTSVGNPMFETLDYNDSSGGEKWPESCVMRVELNGGSDKESLWTKAYNIRADFLKEIHLLIDEAEKNAINVLKR